MLALRTTAQAEWSASHVSMEFGGAPMTGYWFNILAGEQ
jgi:hypothetical protein